MNLYGIFVKLCLNVSLCDFMTFRNLTINHRKSTFPNGTVQYEDEDDGSERRDKNDGETDQELHHVWK